MGAPLVPARQEQEMDLNDLRGSLREALGVTVTEEPCEAVVEPAGTKVVITGPRSLIAPMTDGPDATDTCRMVVMNFTGEGELIG